MSYTYEKIDGNKGVLHFVVPKEEVNAAEVKIYFNEQKKYPVPGFRRGKTPRQVIERYYGPVFRERAINEIVQSSFTEAMKTGDYDPLTQAHCTSDKFAEDGSLVFDIEFEVVPDIELGQYTGLTVDVYQETLKEEDVDVRIERERQRHTTFEPVTDRPIMIGDRIHLDYAGTVEGESFEGGSDENAVLEVGSGRMIKGFEEGLVGMVVDEEKDLHLTFPTPYHSKELEGKDVVFHVKIRDITKPNVPELNDDFVSDISEFSTVAEYRENERQKMQKVLDERNESARLDALADQVVENVTVEISPALRDRYMEQLLNQYKRELSAQGVELDQYLQMTGMTLEGFKSQLVPQAELNAKTNVVLDAIIEKENVEVTDEMFNDMLSKVAASYRVSPEDFEKMTNGQMDEQIRHDVKLNATLRKVAESTTFNILDDKSGEALTEDRSADSEEKADQE